MFLDLVSIPYRYAKNYNMHIKIAKVLRVSIPYRYAKNSANFFAMSNSSLFQFLIGTLKTGSLGIGIPSIFIVSIPYRYAKNKLRQIGNE